MNSTKKYFEENSDFWINDAYTEGDYNYPVGFNRLRILEKILKNYNTKDKLLIDIGCGGGDISIAMAKKGFTVIGVDMSKSMLKTANSRKTKLSKEIRDKIRFIQSDFDQIQDVLKENFADVIVAFGFIGYLQDDDIFFNKCNSLLKPSGKLIVSFRNRLFNMQSISNYTVNEINDNNALKLISELDQLFNEEIPLDKTKHFINNLKLIVNSLEVNDFITSKHDKNNIKNTPNINISIEARQHTPQEVSEVSKKYNFKNMKNYGVHPHLLVPKLNKMLTPQLFNKLSDSLCSFEDLPVSLTWSSVFISEFEVEKCLKY